MKKEGFRFKMNKWAGNTKYSLISVFSSPTYIIIAVAFALTLFLVNIYTINYRFLLSGVTFHKLWTLFIGGFTSIQGVALALLLANVILGGILFSFMIFLLRRQVSFTTAGSGSVGLFTALIAPACPSCALGFLATVGFGGFLSVLPFKGLELGYLAVAILIASLIYMSGKIMTETCEISPQADSEESLGE